MVYLVTGKAGSGKTTFAYDKQKELRQECLQCVIIDGDIVRNYFTAGFEDADRFEHIIRMAKFARILEKQGVIVIISAFLPKRKWRDYIRAMFDESKVVYIEGGTLWKGTEYEEPTQDELY